MKVSGSAKFLHRGAAAGIVLSAALLLPAVPALAQNLPNSLTILTPDPTIQLCNPSPTSCFTPNRAGGNGVSDNGTVAGGNSVFIPATLLPAVSLSTTTIYKNGQWFNIGTQIDAASGVTDGFSYANAISRDGNVVAGYGPTGIFKWTFTGPNPADGTVFLLPNPSPSNQFLISADPVLYSTVAPLVLVPSGALSSDGTTIVGRAFDGSHDSAFRCVGNCTAVQFLPLPGVLPGPSSALGTNADGTVVVGTYNVGGPQWLGYYWSTSAGPLTMPNPAGLTGSAVGYATNGAGTVIVGGTEVTTGASYNGTHATIWRTAGGPTPTFTATDIHNATLGTFSIAQNVNAAGTLVGGTALNNGGGIGNGGAWLWTQATGARLITSILADAGIAIPVDAYLQEVGAISASGEFVMVNTFRSGNNSEGWLLRYITPATVPGTVPPTTPVPPIIGFTNRDSVQRSFDRLADTRTSQMVTARIMSSVLLGINEQVNCGDCFSGFGAVGSFSAGLHGRRSITDSLIAMGGVSFNQSHGKGYKTEASPTFALQFRLDPADWGPARPFLDVGGMIAPNAVTKYSRRYENGISPALGRGSSQSATAMGFARLGYVWRINKEQEAAAYAEFSHLMQRIKGYSEPLSRANPFEAAVRKGTDEMSIVKVGAQFTQLLAANWELNLSGGIAHGFNRKVETAGVVPGFGLITAAKPKDTTWLEYGARISYRVSQTFVIDGFVNGTASGSRSVGNSIHGGFGVRLNF